MTIHSQYPSHVNAARKKRKGPASSLQSTVSLPQFDVSTNTTSSRWNYANPRYTRNTFTRRSYHNHNNSSVETVPKSSGGIDKSHHQHYYHHHTTKPAKVYPPSTKYRNSKTLRKPSPVSSQSLLSPNSTPSPNKYHTSSPPSKASRHQAPYAHSHEQAIAGPHTQNGNHAQVPFSQRMNSGGRTNDQRRTGRNSKTYHRNAPPSNAYTSAQFYGFQNKLRSQQRQARQIPRAETQGTTSSQTGPSATGFVLVRTVDECREAVEALSHHSHIALDCEGVALSRTGRLCLLQVASPDTVYIFDLIDNSATTLIGDTNSPNNSNSDLNPEAELRLKMEQNRAKLTHARQLFEKGGLKELLENDKIIKVMHDCRHDSDALYHQFGIRLGPVIDTQVVFFILRRTMGMEDGLPVSLKTLLRKFSFVSEDELNVKHTVKDRMKGDNEFWLQRPLSDVALWYARLDVHHLLGLTNVLAELIQSSSDQAWADVQRESQLYLSVFRDDFDGPRKAQVEYEMRAKIARRERTAAKVSKKASLHRKNDPLVSFKLDRPRVISALNK